MNDVETRARLLLEAQHLFALYGFRGASVRDITRAAEANLGAITYHFGTKQALHDAVIESVLGRLAAHIEAAAQSPGASRDRIRAVVRALFAFFRDAPEVPRLLIHQVAIGAGIPAVAGPFFRRNLGAITQVVRDGVAQGEFRTTDPTLVAFTIISQSIWFALVGRELPVVMDLPSPEGFADRVEHHVMDVVTRFLEEG
jgi:AcrR family transcriptional regulator